MKQLCLRLVLVAFILAIWAYGHALDQSVQSSYSVKDFCRDHADVCSKSRLAHYATPSPIPSKGFVVIYP